MISRLNKSTCTNVMPSVLNLHIRQIADNEALGFLLLELTVQNIPRCCFITSGFMGVIMSHGVGGNEPLLFHDSTNSTSGNDESAFLDLDFDLTCTVSFSIFVENLHNRFGYRLRLVALSFYSKTYFLRFAGRRTLC